MIRPTLLLSFALASFSIVRAHNGSTLPTILTAGIIEGLGNNSLFNRWRPTYHFISPAGWLNVCHTMLSDDDITKLELHRTHVE